MRPDDAGKALAGGCTDAHGHQMELDQQQGRGRYDPEQSVAEVGTENGIGGDAGGIVIGKAGQQTGSENRHECRNRTDPGAPDPRELRHDAALVMRGGMNRRPLAMPKDAVRRFTRMLSVMIHGGACVCACPQYKRFLIRRRIPARPRPRNGRWPCLRSTGSRRSVLPSPAFHRRRTGRDVSATSNVHPAAPMPRRRPC